MSEEVATFGDPTRELLVATCADGAFARVIYNPAEVIDQALVSPDEALGVAAVAVDGGYELTVTAESYVRDLFCMADKVDAGAHVDVGMVSLLPGESVTLHITSAAEAEPGAFVAPNVLRSANDLKR